MAWTSGIDWISNEVITEVKLDQLTQNVEYNHEYIIPAGGIIMWSGAVGSIPAGWFLCVTGDTEVTLKNGEKRKIDDIVNKKEEVEVVSYDEETGEKIYGKIVDWYKEEVKNKDVWYKLIMKSGRNGGFKRVLDLTDNHPVMIKGRGWVEAKNIKNGDTALVYQDTLTEAGKQAMLGMFISDGSISDNGKFTMSQSVEKNEYTEYMANKYQVNTIIKKEATAEMKNGTKIKGNGGKIFSVSLKTLAPDIIYKKDSLEFLDKIGPIGLAQWFMGDGNLQTDNRTNTERMQFHTECFSARKLDTIEKWLKGFGITTKKYKRTNTAGYILRCDKKSTERLAILIAPYMHEHFRYKLPKKYRNITSILDYIEFREPGFVEYSVSTRKLSSYSKSKRNLSKYKYRYDIKVEGTRNFIANNFVVHNCDGNNGTPDLTEKFIIGIGSANPFLPGDTGGSNSTHVHDLRDHTHGIDNTNLNHSHNMSGHTHSGWTGNENDTTKVRDDDEDNTVADNSHQHYITTGGPSVVNTGGELGNHSHTCQAPSINSTSAEASMPAYYAMCFIMKA